MTQRSLYNIVFLLTLTLMIGHNHAISAQAKALNNNSVWCEHLSEIIKCASLDQISERVCRARSDSDAIAPFVPMLTLTNGKEETMSKQYGKVTYMAICYISPQQDKTLSAQYEKWYNKVKKCLEPWDTSRLDNEDKSINADKDYFITNSEDETTVRLDIVKTANGYAVRMRIF